MFNGPEVCLELRPWPRTLTWEVSITALSATEYARLALGSSLLWGVGWRNDPQSLPLLHLYGSGLPLILQASSSSSPLGNHLACLTAELQDTKVGETQSGQVPQLAEATST